MRTLEERIKDEEEYYDSYGEMSPVDKYFSKMGLGFLFAIVVIWLFS